MRLRRRLSIGSVVMSAVFLNTTLYSATGYAQTPPPAGGVESVEKEHTVVPGDTLWDLSSSYLQNPWYWPKVWSYNPQITNPHFLFPGDKVKFYPGGEQQPTRIAASSTRQMEGGPVTEAGTPAEPQGTVASNDTELPPPPLAQDNDNSAPSAAVSGSPGLGNDLITRQMIIQTLELMTKQELKEAGVIERARDDKQLLSNYDIAYVRFTGEKPAASSRVLFYRTVREVEHPSTGDDVGFLTQITGTGIVMEGGGDSKFTAVQVEATFDGIERGQLVAPQTEPLRRSLAYVANETKVDGEIITGEQHSEKLIGQFHYVFLDRGTRDGVKNGNSFTVINTRDEFAEDDIPAYPVGKLVVIDAKETASMAVVVQSIRDLKPGDHIEMRQ